MPYPNFHTCRIEDPKLFEEGSFRTLKTKTNGLKFISGKLKSTGTSTVQSYRYDKKIWSSDRAQKHCTNHKGNFEQATKKSLTSSDIPNLLAPGGIPIFQGKSEKGLAYKICLIENIERGASKSEAIQACEIFKLFNFDDNKHYLETSILNENIFVYHHHWKDIDEYEASSSEILISSDNELLGELKFNMKDYMLKYNVHFNKEQHYDSDELMTIEPKKYLNVTLDKKTSTDWLEIKDTYMKKNIDDDNEMWSAYFLVDKGNYTPGVRRKHFHEYFLEGSILKGRYLFIYAPISKKLDDSEIESILLEDTDNIDLDEERRWLLLKPNDQKPYAESHKLDDVIAELKNKNQKWLIWSSPNVETKRINVGKYNLEKTNIDLFAEKEIE